MKTAARTMLSTVAAAIAHVTLFQGLWIAFCGIAWLFIGAAGSWWFFTISGCVLCYLPALLTGLILERVKGIVRPGFTAPLGVIVSWVLFLGYGALASGSNYWTADQNSIVPWPFNYWTADHYFLSLLILLTSGLAAQLGVEWSQPRRATKWLLILLVIFDVVLAGVTAHYFTLPYLNIDEVEHAHVTWSLSQGVIPYRDVHQLHMPLLWILTWPIMNWLPWTVESMLALRSACVAALMGSYLGGLLILREIYGSIHRVHALVLLLLLLAVAPDFQLGWVRPDPFMTLFSVWAIVATVRMRRAPARYSFLCGIALGVAASFSIRVSWLCFLVPLVSLWECCRQRTLRPLWLVIPNGAGFALGILPVAAWILYHGVLRPFWIWVIAGNSGLLHNPFEFPLYDSVFINRVVAALALLGGVCLLWSQRRATKEAWSPSNAVVVSGLLAWLVPIMNPMHRLVPDLHYNFQIFAIPGAVLGTVFVARLLAWDARVWQLRLVAVGLLFALIEAQTPAPVWGGGSALSKAQFQELNRLCSGKDATCVGFAPLHPIFCRDAVDLYLKVDEALAKEPFCSPSCKAGTKNSGRRPSPPLRRERRAWSWILAVPTWSRAKLANLAFAVKACGRRPVKIM